ncbi:DNA translocase FtsK [Sporosarcina oncorhynchi]|uniref:DNA translocase FtsK n=1 Tax=Sporosarcina oncorhynchi TaxID=3056444 RepID=A0ABZ0L7T1_9BACL|nr:DNA translocase FtsK [Sporosarcina sp. T2O-4]WOV88560.1 DNA translocase FtsK [Sporosarcina sp. T2O-4]
MTWIKKMMARMFDEEPTKEMADPENLDHKDEIKEDKPRERPAFRFPIITDAEIYGWDSDPEVKDSTEIRAAKELVTELDDEFEPIPLYKNDRWPVQTEKVTIHRATPRLKYGETANVQPTRAFSQSEKPDNEVREEVIKKRNNRPFTPTEVPSPVYGYKKPVPLHKKDKDMDEIKINSDKVDEEKTDLIEENVRIENDYSVHTSVQEESIVFPDALDEVQASTQSIQEKNEMTIDEPESLEVGSEVEEVLHADESEDLVTIEEHSIVDDAMDLAAEEAEPTKTEKTVPFNVLMLKNDKAKYEQRLQAKYDQQTVDKTNVIERTVEETIAHSIPEIPVERASVTVEPETELEDQPYYAFPSKDFLVQAEEHIEDTEWLQTQSEKLEEALSYFAVQANVIEAVQGPTVTRFELTVGHGTKVSKIRNLTDDLKLALAAEDIRIQAPIPGTSSIGIEIPNRKPRAVRISEVIETKRFQESDSPLEAVLGLSLTGEPVTLDLRKMPHGMIAGATGSGKSVCINSILISLLYKSSPTDLKMLLIDPKMVELAPFNGIPHLLSPVITDVKAATAALKWAVGEMERRYELFAHIGARNIERYNEMAEKERKFSLKLPYLLIVIDELADLMMMAPADVEVSISRITQKARACGIHLIIATQRPSVDVITGTIKANVPTRIAFSVSSQIDSRTIIDTPGAERLLGKGDMLYLGNGQSSPVRLQGTFVTDEEIERIIEHVQNEAEPDYLFGQEDLLANIVDEEETDPLFIEACRFIIEQGSASTSLLQRNFSIGYNRAAKLMDRMEKLGFISEQRGTKAREVFLTDSNFEQFLNGSEQTV